MSRAGAQGGLRILHLAFDDPRRPGSGGGAVRNHEINRRLARRHQVTAVTVTYPGARKRVEDGVRYLPVGLPLGYRGAILTYFLALPLVIFTHPCDLLVEDFAAPFGSLLARLWSPARVVAQIQWLSAAEKSRQYHLPFFLTERWGVRSHRHLIAVSRDVARRIQAMNPRAQVVVIPNGVDPAAFEACAGERHDVLYLGRLEVEGKGLDLLLKAFATVAPRVSEDLLIAGDGPDRQALGELVERLGLAGRVRLVGRVAGPRRFDLLARARLLCMPTRYETFGMVALEAMACGTPVVAFDIPALRELLGRRALVPAFDVQAYSARCLAELADPDRCRVEGERIRRRARGYDWDRIARRQERVYRWAAAEPHTVAARRRRIAWVAAPVLAALAAFAVRLPAIGHGLEVQVDELVYLRISQNVAHSMRLAYDLGGRQLFFLHPPLYFFIEAGYLRLVRPAGDVIQQVIAVRYLAAAFGAASTAVVLQVCRQLGLGRSALVAALVFALEPFIVLMSSRNYLEAAALFWVLLGLWAVLRLPSAGRRPALWLAPAAGLAFGAALLTNEPVAVMTLVPVSLAATWGALPARRAAATLLVALGAYAVYPLAVLASGNFGQFWLQKTSGLERFAGLVLTTGFNGSSGPSFVSTVVANWPVFTPTYALLAVGLLATLILAFQPDAQARLVALWAGSAYALQAYAVLFGTNEEQYFYYVTALAVLAVTVAAQRLVAAAPLLTVQARRALTLAPAAGPAALGALVVAWAWRSDATASFSPGGVARLESGLFRSAVGLPVAMAAASLGGLVRLPLPGFPAARIRASLLAVALTVFVAWSGAIAVSRYTVPDDGYLRLAAYMQAQVPRGTPVACTSAVEAVLMRMDGYPVTDMALVTQEGQKRTRISVPSVLLAGHPQYVTVTTRLLEENYGVATPRVERWLKDNAELAFSFKGPSDGTLEMFRITKEAT